MITKRFVSVSLSLRFKIIKQLAAPQSHFTHLSFQTNITDLSLYYIPVFRNAINVYKIQASLILHVIFQTNFAME